jgi:hypothetical protein
LDLRQAFRPLLGSSLRAASKLHAAAENLVSNIFPDRACVAAKEVLDAVLPIPKENDNSAYDHALKFLDFESAVKSVMTTEFFDVFASTMRGTVQERFEADNAGPIQLCRFPAVRDAYCDSLSSIADQQKFVTAITSLIDWHFAKCSFNVGLYLDRELLMDGLHCCVLQHLVIGMSDVKKSSDRAREAIQAVPDESCADNRRRYNECLDKINEIKSLYESILARDEQV